MNAQIGIFNSTLVRDPLDVEVLYSLDDPQVELSHYRRFSNEQGQHSSLDDPPPAVTHAQRLAKHSSQSVVTHGADHLFLANLVRCRRSEGLRAAQLLTDAVRTRHRKALAAETGFAESALAFFDSHPDSHRGGM